MTVPTLLAHETVADWLDWRARAAARAHSRRWSPSPSGAYSLFGAGEEPLGEGAVVVAVDDVSPTVRASLLAPADLLVARGVPVALLAPAHLADALAVRGFRAVADFRDPSRSPVAPAAVLALSHAVGAGAAGWVLAGRVHAPFLVVQHGVVTPYAPPLPAGAVLLAWSARDAAFWLAGRVELEVEVVGSELLWQAAQLRRERADAGERLCFLGQLHGAELGRDVTVRTVASIARTRPVLYRPHPAERDPLSLVRHERWRRGGVTVGSPNVPLTDEEGPVVGIFSTGILEAAACGLDAYATCARPPGWVEELWLRYSMAPLGAREATVVTVPPRRPAEAIADLVEARR